MAFMTKPDTFQVIQHDRETLAEAVTAITGLPTEVGDTCLSFLATLTPATSGGVRFQLWSDGHVESMDADCPACGRTTAGPSRFDDSATERYARLHLLTRAPKRSLLARLVRRAFGCRTCSNDTLLPDEAV